MLITKLDDVIQEAKKRPTKKIVVAYAQDSHSIGAVYEAKKLNLVEPILVGDKEIIFKVCKEENIDPNSFEIVDVKGEIESGKKAVELILEGKGDIIMKGLISSDDYLRALLNKEKGLLPYKGVLSHIIVMEAKNYHKLILASDTAVIPYPDLNQKIAMVKYLISLAHDLGIKCPKVAVISAIEKVNPSMPCSIDAALLTMMNKRKQISGGIVDGPLSVDLSLDEESKLIKNIDSEVAADADCLLFPDIQAGNTFYKTATKLAGAKMAAVVVGTKVPAVLSSRGDTIETKLYSIALSTLMVK